MRFMLNGLLEFSRSMTRGQQLSRVDANECLQQAFEDLAKETQTLDAKLIVSKLPAPFADPRQLSKVFRILMENCLQNRGEQGLEIRVDGELQNQEVLFFVSDNGLGIPRDELVEVFNVFYKLDRDRDSGRCGIGLALARRIVERHGGRMWTESNAGAGSTFYFTMPEP